MIVCVCHAVSTVHLEVLMSNGVDTVEAIGRRCGAGTDCGSCKAELSRMVEERRATESARDEAGSRTGVLYCRNADPDAVGCTG